MRGREVKEEIIQHPHMQKETDMVFTFSEWFLWVFRGLSPSLEQKHPRIVVFDLVKVEGAASVAAVKSTKTQLWPNI